MRALTYHGSKDVRVDTVPDPTLAAPDDLILRVTATAIAARTFTYTVERFPTFTPVTFWAMSSWGSWRR